MAPNNNKLAVATLQCFNIKYYVMFLKPNRRNVRNYGKYIKKNTNFSFSLVG